MPREARAVIMGGLHHVYGRGIEGRHIFWETRDYHIFLEKLKTLASVSDISIASWCLVPDYFHLIVRVGKTPLAQFMRRLLTSYAIYYNRAYKRSGPLFGDRYGSRLMQDDPYFLEISRYMHLMPVHEGIVHDPMQYPFSSFREIVANSDLKIINQHEIDYLLGKGNEPREKYRKFVYEGIEKDQSAWEPFKETRKNESILGSARFATSSQQKFFHTINPSS